MWLLFENNVVHKLEVCIQLNEFLKTKRIYKISTQAKKLKLPAPRSIHGAASGHWQPPDFPELNVFLNCI